MSFIIWEADTPGVPTQVQKTALPCRAFDKALATLSGSTGTPLLDIPTPAANESPITKIRIGFCSEDGKEDGDESG